MSKLSAKRSQSGKRLLVLAGTVGLLSGCVHTTNDTVDRLAPLPTTTITKAAETASPKPTVPTTVTRKTPTSLTATTGATNSTATPSATTTATTSATTSATTPAATSSTFTTLAPSGVASEPVVKPSDTPSAEVTAGGPSASPSAGASSADVLTVSYQMNERSEQVKALQKFLGSLAVDGWYGAATRAAHISALTKLNLPTSNVPELPATTTPPTATPVVRNAICTDEQAVLFAHQLLDPYHIVIPQIAIAPVHRSQYNVGQSRIDVEKCQDLSGVAHEIGHYVMDKANGFDWNQHVADAAANFAGNWVKGREVSRGVEHSAHCIGHQLWGEGTFTRCPNASMAAYAQSVIERAAK